MLSKGARWGLIAGSALAVLLAWGVPVSAEGEEGTEGTGGEVGARAPDFTLFDCEGRPTSLSDFEGVVRLVAFVTPGIAVCDLQLRTLNQLRATYVRRGLVVLAISTQRDPGYLRSYAEELGLEYGVLAISSAVDAAYGRPEYLPTTFVIGRDGVVRGRYEGYTEEWVMAGELQEVLGQEMPLEVGARAPSFGAYDIVGRKARLDQFSGRWAVLMFVPGLMEEPWYGWVKNFVEKTYFAGQSRPAMLVFVPEKAEQVAMAVEAMPLPPWVVSDPWQLISGVYKALDPETGKPRAGVVVVDPGGVIYYIARGTEPAEFDAAVEVVKSLPAPTEEGEEQSP